MPIITVIHYTYDRLNRLAAAEYSRGEGFAYVYDPAGNVFTHTRTLATGQDVTTVYAYNAANQLVTAEASDDQVTWYYTYDANGNLTEVTPDGLAPDNGARRYTYNRAGHLVRVETHDGAAYRPQAEMVYNGVGQRVALTAWTAVLSLTTHYVLDPLHQSEPLAATAAGQTTFYVHGHGPLAELTGEWTYYLIDGNRTVRQLSDADGSITLARSYTPWGELLEQHGGGDLTWGYFGGLLDAATGLIYVGHGQYYDPRTGRFLSPSGNGRNPYLPASPGDPLGALLGTMALGVLLARRRRGKGKGKGDGLLLVLGLVLLVSVSGGLLACNRPTPDPVTPQPPSTPPEPVPSPTPVSPLPTPTTPPPSPTPACTPSQRTAWETQYGEEIARQALILLTEASQYYIWGANVHPEDEDYHYPPPREKPAPGVTWGGVDIHTRTAGRIPIVCADIVSISYARAGLNLEETYPAWNSGGSSGHSSRDVFMLGVLLRDHHQEHHWDDDGSEAMELGDMVLTGGYGHSAVVAEIQGDDPSHIFVVQASYSQDAIQKWSLAEWGTAGIHYGHPWP